MSGSIGKILRAVPLAKRIRASEATAIRPSLRLLTVVSNVSQACSERCSSSISSCSRRSMAAAIRLKPSAIWVSSWCGAPCAIGILASRCPACTFWVAASTASAGRMMARPPTNHASRHPSAVTSISAISSSVSCLRAGCTAASLSSPTAMKNAESLAALVWASA